MIRPLSVEGTAPIPVCNVCHSIPKLDMLICIYMSRYFLAHYVCSSFQLHLSIISSLLAGCTDDIHPPHTVLYLIRNVQYVNLHIVLRTRAHFLAFPPLNFYLPLSFIVQHLERNIIIMFFMEPFINKLLLLSCKMM